MSGQRPMRALLVVNRTTKATGPRTDGEMLAHPAGAHTAAHYIAQAIRRRVPTWDNRVENLSWILEALVDDDLRAVVVATGQLGALMEKPRGPLVVGLARDVEIRISLPDVIDKADVDAVLAALTALSILPATSP